jgi:hypothetical protein
MVVHTCNPSTGEAETGGLGDQGQCGSQSQKAEQKKTGLICKEIKIFHVCYLKKRPTKSDIFFLLLLCRRWNLGPHTC